MTDPRHTDPQNQDPLLAGGGLRRERGGNSTWAWIIGAALVVLIAFIAIAGWNSNFNTASNAPPATPGSASTATKPPPATTGSAATKMAPSAGTTGQGGSTTTPAPAPSAPSPAPSTK